MDFLNYTRSYLIVIAILLFTWTKKCTSQQAVSVQISGDRASPALGYNYTLTCNVSGAYVTNYQWLKDDKVILNVTESSFFFHPLGLSDSGLYICTIIVNSTSYNSSIGITLQLPSPISVTVTSDPASPIQPFVFTNVTLTCTVELSPAVDVPVTVNMVWTGPAGFMTKTTAQPVMGSTTTYNSTAMVSSFGRDQSGEYLCSATISSTSPFLDNSSLSESRRITTGVYLSFNGSVLINDSTIAIDIIQTMPNQVHLMCTSDRIPCCKDTTRYGEWYFSNSSQVKHKVHGAVAFHRTRDNFGNVFLWRLNVNVTSPTGKFCCEVEDATHKNQTLCVNICNSINVQITDGIATPTLGQSYSLSCSVTRAQVDTYQWSKDGTILTETGPDLTFHSLTFSDSGLYTCTITVDSVTYEGSVEVILQLPAPISLIITSEPASPIRPVGSNVTLKCTVELTFTEIYSLSVTVNTVWTGPDRFMTTNNAQPVMGSTITTTYTSTVMVSSFGRDQSGVYTCSTRVSSINMTLSSSDSESSTTRSRVTVGTYLFHNGLVIEPNSNIGITEIGTLQPHQLVCITDRRSCCKSPYAAGEWIFPNGTNVTISGDHAIHFYRDRGPNGEVNMYRVNDDVVTPTGSFCCRVPDANNTIQTVCVNVVSEFIQITQSEAGPRIPIIAGSIGVFSILFIIICIITIVVCALMRNTRRNVRQCIFSSDKLIESPSLKKSNPEAIELKRTDEICGIRYEQDHPEHTVPLSDFVDYVNNMHANDHFEQEFDSLEIYSVVKPSHDISQLLYNKEKNRFVNIIPYDTNRVKLSEIPAVDGSDYINASFLNGYGKQKAYIAAQGPLPNTLDDFWRMIWEQKLPTIVMLTKCFEDRKKCERYWPENEGELFNPGHNLKVKLTRSIPFSEFVIRKLTVERDSEPATPPFEVTQLHFTAWPDHGVPSNTSVMLNIISHVRKLHPYSDPRPLLVHCSAGVGRTGTFIVLDSMLERMKTEESFNIFEFVQQLREGRVSMVQSLAQYIFIHDALRELIMCGETEILAPNLENAINKLRHTKDRTTGFKQQFQKLETLLPKFKGDSFTTAMEEYNVNKNRYPDNIPISGDCFSGIVLKWNGEQGSNYINASFINGYKQRRAYIATQGPLESTVNDFWRMIWEQKSCCVVMLCQLEENDEEMSVQYWPGEVDQPQVYGKLTVKKINEERHGDFVWRAFEVDEEKQQTSSALDVKTALSVTQFQYLVWPEHETPPITSSLIELVDNINKVQMGSGNRPMIVMCNDGVGRTGAFISIHAQLERLKTEGVVDFFQFVKSARMQRPGVILDVGQYELCHTTVLQYLKSCEDYANFKDVM